MRPEWEEISIAFERGDREYIVVFGKAKAEISMHFGEIALYMNFKERYQYLSSSSVNLYIMLLDDFRADNNFMPFKERLEDLGLYEGEIECVRERLMQFTKGE